MRAGHFAFIIVLLFVYGIGGGIAYRLDQEHQLQHRSARLRINMENLETVSKALHDYKEKHGRYPTNDEGLSVIHDEFLASKPRHFTYRDTRLNDSGILTVWHEPYVYENRIGLDQEKFADSGATLDVKRKYSIQVDENIFAWSTAAEKNYHEYSHWNRVIYGTWNAVRVVFLLTFAVYGFFMWRSYEKVSSVGKKITRLVVTFISAGLVGAFLGMMAFCVGIRSCYEPMIFYPRRTTEVTSDYLQLVDKYRERGIITDKTYKKIVKVIEEEPSY